MEAKQIIKEAKRRDHPLKIVLRQIKKSQKRASSLRKEGTSFAFLTSLITSISKALEKSASLVNHRISLKRTKLNSARRVHTTLISTQPSWMSRR